MKLGRKHSALLLVAAFTALMPLAIQPCGAVTIPRDASALTGMRQAMASPAALASWTGSDPCNGSWVGVAACGPSRQDPTVQAVLQLRLPGLGLGGVLSPLVGNLTDLEVLDLASNRLGGYIPSEIGTLVHLQELHLSDNLFNGSIPSTLSSLTRLTLLALDLNRLTGQIPFGLGTLISLTCLRLDNNQLGGSIPVPLQWLASLKQLILNNNVLQGGVPSQLGNLTNLAVMRLDYNLLSGSLPSSLARLAALEELSVRNNSLSGTIPAALGTMGSLLRLDLGYNTLSGAIPVSLFSLPRLAWLALDQNQLSGSLPWPLGSSTALETVVLNGNNLTGTGAEITLNPTSQMLSLYLHNNNLTGAPPSAPPTNAAGTAVDLTVFGNPLCSTNRTAAYCVAPLTVTLPPTVEGEAQAGLLPAPASASCTCPSGQLRLPATLGPSSACACAYPALLKLSLPRKSIPTSSYTRLQYQLARGLLLLPGQVGMVPTVGGPVAEVVNGTTAFVISVVPLKGAALTDTEFSALQSRLTPAALTNRLILDGDFGEVTVTSSSNTAPSPASNTGGGSRTSAVVAVGIALVSAAVVGLVALLIWHLIRRRMRRKRREGWTLEEKGVGLALGIVEKGVSIAASTSPSPPPTKKWWGRKKAGPPPAPQEPGVVRILSRAELAAATDNFASRHLLGKGQFGSVYYGLLDHGTPVVVKRLDRTSKLNELDFRTEVQLIGHHLCNPRVVQLLGYCVENGQNFLVYEYMHQGSLAGYLRVGGQQPRSVLDWNTRMRIAREVAACLQYLHSGVYPPEPHVDLKAANVLLGESWEVKIGDVGMPRLFPGDDGLFAAAAMSETDGYQDPDVNRSMTPTTQSDVYCLGVLLLELISGRRATDPSAHPKKEILANWVHGNLLNRDFLIHELVDPQLQLNYPLKGLQVVAAIATQCLQEKAATRPTAPLLVKALGHEALVFTHNPIMFQDPPANRYLGSLAAKVAGTDTASLQWGGGRTYSLDPHRVHQRRAISGPLTPTGHAQSLPAHREGTTPRALSWLPERGPGVGTPRDATPEEESTGRAPIDRANRNAGQTARDGSRRHLGADSIGPSTSVDDASSPPEVASALSVSRRRPTWARHSEVPGPHSGHARHGALGNLDVPSSHRPRTEDLQGWPSPHDTMGGPSPLERVEGPSPLERTEGPSSGEYPTSGGPGAEDCNPQVDEEEPSRGDDVHRDIPYGPSEVAGHRERTQGGSTRGLLSEPWTGATAGAKTAEAPGQAVEAPGQAAKALGQAAEAPGQAAEALGQAVEAPGQAAEVLGQVVEAQGQTPVVMHMSGEAMVRRREVMLLTAGPNPVGGVEGGSSSLAGEGGGANVAGKISVRRVGSRRTLSDGSAFSYASLEVLTSPNDERPGMEPSSPVNQRFGRGYQRVDLDTPSPYNELLGPVQDGHYERMGIEATSPHRDGGT